MSKVVYWDEASQTWITQRQEPVPIGTISLFGGATPPSGWLQCNGAAVSRTTYSDLFQIVGTTFGAGNGTTTFNVPTLTNSPMIYIIKF